MKNLSDQKFIILSLTLTLTLLILVALFFLYPPYQTPTIDTSPVQKQDTASSPYLSEEEVIIVEEVAGEKESQIVLPVQKVFFEYVEVTDSCGPHFEGECLRAREGPGTDFPITIKLRTGMVLKIGGQVEREGVTWYKIMFDEWLRYPERLTNDWYVAADHVEVLLDEGDKTIWHNKYSTTTGKKIVVDRSEQKLYTYNDDVLFKEMNISTGLEITPTPRGTFTVYKKTPSRYMQGPLPNLVDQQVYDLPGVPWNLYFTEEGAVIHGAYWHNNFGSPYSHGCVNLAPENARELYMWTELGTIIIVQD